MTTADVESRAALLRSVIDSTVRSGRGARSLRDIARGAGTSHRMLIHHFGSREGLLVAVVTEVEAQQRELLRTLSADGGDPVATMWARLADPGMWPFERLFFATHVGARASRRSTASCERSSRTGS